MSEKLSVPTCILRPEYADTGIPKESLSEPEIKNDNQIECIRQSCTLAKQILRHVRKIIKVIFLVTIFKFIKFRLF